MKTWIPNLAQQIIRRLPFRARKAFFSLVSGATATAGNRKALVELFILHDILESEIDRCAIRYGDGVHPKHRLMRYHEFFVSRITPGETVLDIGCGRGMVAYSLAMAGAKVTGIDLNEENIRAARERYQHPNLSFITGDATRVLPPGSFKTVIASNVLEHIENRIDFLNRVQQAIKPDRWLIRVPVLDRHWHSPLKQELGLSPFSDPAHFTEYTLASFMKEMDAAGLSIRHLDRIWGEIWAEVTHE